MVYIGDSMYWNKNFKLRNNKLLNPEISLVDNIDILKNGSVLDLACGDGRNTLFLLKNGFRVTGIDFSIEALNRLENFAEEEGYMVKTIYKNLEEDFLKDLEIFDNIIINHYKLNKNYYKDIKNNISKNGILFVSGFGYRHKTDFKIKKKDLILDSDFKLIKNDFDLIKYIEKEDEIGFFVTYIFRKKTI